MLIVLVNTAPTPLKSSTAVVIESRGPTAPPIADANVEGPACAEKEPYLPVPKSAISVQELPFQFSVIALTGFPSYHPPIANAAVALPAEPKPDLF